MTRIYRALAALLVFLTSCATHTGSKGLVNIPWGISAVGYPAHVEIRWNDENGASYDIWKAEGKRFVKVGTACKAPYLDFSVGHSDAPREISYRLCPAGLSHKVLTDKEFLSRNPRAKDLSFKVNVPAASDEALLDMIEKYTVRYFTDFAEPFTGMARERSNDRKADIVTTGGSGFGLMAIIAAA